MAHDVLCIMKTKVDTDTIMYAVTRQRSTSIVTKIVISNKEFFEIKGVKIDSIEKVY
jgi:hypothetical protein